jgi:YidC/Oxa1 family membrane protein insertase
MPPRTDTKNLTIAFILSVLVLFVWQWLMPPVPPQAPVAANTTAAPKAVDALPVAIEPAYATKADALAATPRLKIDNGKLHGSLPLKGAGLRMDDLTLVRYRETVDPKSPEVTLLSPANMRKMYFADFGWTASDPKITLPDENTVWKADQEVLKADAPVTLRWVNPEGVRFSITLVLDGEYLFSITRRVEDKEGKPIALGTFGRINREWTQEHEANYILHEGLFGVFNNTLEEVSYHTLKEEKERPRKEFSSATQSWLGVGDKYWFTAFIPSADQPIEGRYSYYQRDNHDRFQVDYTQAASDAPVRFYAGPKEVKLLDRYKDTYQIPLFDRAVDFGMFYFLTKPIFLALQYLYGLAGNFGIAILMLTVVIRLILYPLANKSYHSIAQMREIQPKMQALKERVGDDKMRLQQELIALYKAEKINPMAGCLPVLLQIPVFFSLYKVLYVTIEMRHAPFYGWIKDLSAQDPTSVLHAFGLLSYPIALPTFLMIGAWPLIMMGTMIVQQHFQPAPTDPVQAKMMKALPYVFVFLFASFPAGLVIYWAWNNTLSVLQQWVIIQQHKRKQARAEAAPVKVKTPKAPKKKSTK